jgi:hypothetical protein
MASCGPRITDAANAATRARAAAHAAFGRPWGTWDKSIMKEEIRRSGRGPGKRAAMFATPPAKSSPP